MHRLALSGLLCLLLAACGGDPNEALGGAEYKELEAVVAATNRAMEDFVAAAGKAENAEQFAGAVSKLAKQWGAAGRQIKVLLGKVAILAPDEKRFNDIVNRLDPAIAKREKALEAGCEKWAETDVVQKALGEYLEANKSWE